jgi:ADP-ribosylglycohydrolase
MATKTSSTSKEARLSKTLGALLGVHAGDSLGATLEFDSYARIRAKYPNGLRDIIGGGPFRWNAGDATDDTDLTRAVLLAYRDRQNARNNPSSSEPFDLIKAAAEYALEWAARGPNDIGGATSTGIWNYERSRDPRTSGAGPDRAGNGSLMRCIPTALFTHNMEDRVEESKAISAFTHNDTRCTTACVVYNEIVAALLEGKNAEFAVQVGLDVGLDVVQTLSADPGIVAAIKYGQSLNIPELAEKGPPKELSSQISGFVLGSFSLAIAAVLDPRSLEDVLVDVVRLGGDTDTNGAIAGGLLGARDGVEAIPERWLNVLQFKSEFEGLAKGLLDG